MTQLIFAVLLFVLAGFDTWLTQRRISRYGIGVELNRAIRWLSNKIGPEFAAVLGVMTPATALIAIALIAHLQWVLPLLVGFRLRQFFVQCESLAFERDIRHFADELKSASISPAHHPPSMVAPPASVEHKKPGTLS